MLVNNNIPTFECLLHKKIFHFRQDNNNHNYLSIILYTVYLIFLNIYVQYILENNILNFIIYYIYDNSSLNIHNLSITET